MYLQPNVLQRDEPIVSHTKLSPPAAYGSLLNHKIITPHRKIKSKRKH